MADVEDQHRSHKGQARSFAVIGQHLTVGDPSAQDLSVRLTDFRANMLLQVVWSTTIILSIRTSHEHHPENTDEETRQVNIE